MCLSRVAKHLSPPAVSELVCDTAGVGRWLLWVFDDGQYFCGGDLVVERLEEGEVCRGKLGGESAPDTCDFGPFVAEGKCREANNLPV